MSNASDAFPVEYVLEERVVQVDVVHLGRVRAESTGEAGSCCRTNKETVIFSKLFCE